MDIIKENFGKCLRNLRKMKNYTQEALAEKVGINLRQLARIEAGESFITSETLYNICEKLEIEPWELFNFELKEQFLMQQDDDKMYLNVIKSGNIYQPVSKPVNQEINNNYSIDNLNNNLEKLSRSLMKKIVVNIIENGNTYCSKTFTPNGDITIDTLNNESIQFIELKEKIDKISNDNKKISFINLACESLSDKSALNELKILIKGIELMLD